MLVRSFLFSSKRIMYHLTIYLLNSQNFKIINPCLFLDSNSNSGRRTQISVEHRFGYTKSRIINKVPYKLINCRPNDC